MILAADLDSHRQPRSIRSRLVRIVFILIAPAVIGLAALAFGLYQNAREQISQNTIATARAVGSALDRDLAGTTTAAQVLAGSSLLASDDLAAFHRQAKQILPLLHGYAIVLADATGQQVVNTLVPYGEPLPMRGGRASLEKVFETGQPSVSDYFIGSNTHKPAFFVDVPVLRDNHIKYILGVALRPSRFDDLVYRQQLPPDWVATILDASGVIVAHSRNPALVGTMPPVLPSAITSSQPALIETIRPDGTPIFVAFSKSDVSSWNVAISVPTAQLSRRPNAILLYGGISMLVVLIVGLVLATYESARIARALQDLIPPALALGRGEAPNTARLSVREADEVAQALDRAHQLLRNRTAERDSAEEKEKQACILTGMMNEFVNNVSHELRTPLTSIAGTLGLLAGGAIQPLAPPVDRLVSIAHRNVQRLVRLVNDILDIARLETGEAIFHFEAIDLCASVAQSVDASYAFAQGQGVSIRLDVLSPSCMVRADADRLAQVLTNLLSNAIKFSPQGAEVVITVKHADTMGRVTVRDQGPGIPEEFKSRIFGKFAQAETGDARQKSGSGLGLNIVAKIVGQHAGQVGSEDAPGGGTVFFVEVPLWDCTAKEMVKTLPDSYDFAA
jgi:signal transduction histidine kinase